MGRIPCSGPTSLPGDVRALPIPKDIKFALAPVTNASKPAMDGCCSPSLVSVIEDCYVWCEISDSRVYKTDGETTGSFSDCFYHEVRKMEGERVVLYVEASTSTGGRNDLSVRGLALGLVAAGLLGFTV